jgi:broad specificity phosphatase PhoE
MSKKRVVVLIKHGTPVLDAAVPPREWVLAPAGEAEAERLAERLSDFAPFRLSTSPEPKASRTAAIIAGRFGVAVHEVDDLREYDRPALPIMTPELHRQVNAAIFTQRDRPVLGSESPESALRRFDSAVAGEVAASTPHNAVLVTHGTVMALFAAAYNPVDAFTLWAGLACGSMLVLDASTFRLPTVPQHA